MIFEGREAVRVENEHLRITVLREGGHVAELLHKPTGVNPLWVPPWKSIEPSQYRAVAHPEYGRDEESHLLSGIMGHNLCLDVFGPPSVEEAAAGLSVHGEGSVAKYKVVSDGRELVTRAVLESAGLSFSRRLVLSDDEVHFSETVENIRATDRPIAWTQHVTLGTPFLESGVTQFQLTATKSRVYEGEGFDDGGLKAGADYEWPHAPLAKGGTIDQRVFTTLTRSSKFTSHLMDPVREDASFTAVNPKLGVQIGYQWKRADFPWLGIWEEKNSRPTLPWNGRTTALGMEFGVSPVPETRRQMIERGRMFGVPAYMWLPARTRKTVEYTAFVRAANA